jgi:hypothetical protein
MFTNIIDHSRLVAPLEQSNYIIYSSFLFFIPSFYAFKNDQKFISTSLLIASLASINYWRDPTYSWRRIIDHISSKILFIIFFINGILLASDPIFFISEIICLGLFIYCYFMSDKYCNYNIHINDIDPCWWKYHMLFHFFAVCSQMLIIYYSII